MSAGSAPRWRRATMAFDYFVLMPLLARVSWRLVLWWGRRRGDLMFWWRGEGRRAAMANVQHAHHGGLAPAELRRIVRGSFRAQTCEEAETYFYASLTGTKLARFIHVEGREHLDAALAAGRGAIVFSSHYGSMCLAMIGLAKLGYRVNVLARSLEPEHNPLGAIVQRYAEGKVTTLEHILERPFIIAGKPGSMESVRSALAANEVLYILLSVPPELARHRGRVRFLGHPAELPLGAEFIATESGAPLVPFVVRRDTRRLGHTLVIRAPVPGPEAGEGTLQRCIDALERDIWADPSQFFMWEFARSFWIDAAAPPSIDERSSSGYEARAHAS